MQVSNHYNQQSNKRWAAAGDQYQQQEKCTGAATIKNNKKSVKV